MAKVKANSNKTDFNTTDKVFTVSIEKIHFDKDYKAVFKQEEDKVQRITEDMKLNGYDNSQPIIIDENYAILDGNSRYMACNAAGITKIPVIIKKFASKKEALVYELNLQMNRRNIASDDVLIDTYHTIAAMTDNNGNKLFTDAEIAEKLGISLRQLAKAKEVDVKASERIKKSLSGGKISLNMAYNKMKEESKPVVIEPVPPVKENKIEAKPEKQELSIKTETVSNEKPAAKPAEQKNQIIEKKTEKISLEFSSDDFTLIQKSAEIEKLTVTEYVKKIITNSIHSVSEKKTA